MTADMTGYRKAAVALHALSEADRQWVLAELPEADRSTLVGYLEELKGMGFVGDAAMAEDAAPAAPVVAVAPRQPIEFIRHATPVEMCAILDGEPSSLVAQLLAIENWQWKSAFMQMCSPIRQDRIRAALVSSKEPVSVRRQFLVHAVGERVKAGRAMSLSTSGTQTGRDAVAGAVKQAVSSFLRLAQSWKR